MYYDYLTPLFMNSIIFYLIGIFLLFLILYLHIFSPNNNREFSVIFTKKVKFLILLFSLIFSSIFVGLYHSPFAFVISKPTIVNDILLAILLASILSMMVINSFRETLDKYPAAFRIIIRISIIALSLAISFVFVRIYVYETYFTPDLNQNLLFLEVLVTIIFGLLIFSLILKGIKLLMKPSKSFKNNYHRVKYSVFFLMIFLFFTMFSYQSQLTVQSNDLNSSFYVPGLYTFSNDLSEVAYFAQQNSLIFIVVKNLTSNIVTSYPISDLNNYQSKSFIDPNSIVSMSFFNSSYLEFDYISLESKILYGFNLKTNLLTKV